MAMRWHHFPTSSAWKGDHYALSEPAITKRTEGWDDGPYQVMVVGDRDVLNATFYAGRPFLDIPGIYVVDVTPTECKGGTLTVGTVQLAGIVGGSRTHYGETVQLNTREREMKAEDYLFSDSNGRTRYWRTPAGPASVVRLTSPVVSFTRQYVTNVAPQTASLRNLIYQGVAPRAPIQELTDFIGIDMVYNKENGAVPRVGSWTKFPAPNVNLWLVNVEWMQTPVREAA